MNRVGIVRQSVRDRIEGRAIVTGPPLRRMSKCLLCNLDSGPWLTTQAAEVSGLLHITGHHACMDDGSHAYGPDCEGQALDYAAAKLRRALDEEPQP